MKKAHIAATLFASLTLATPTVVTAGSRQQALQTCSVYRDKAIEIMQIRQQEAPSIQLSQALDIYGGTDMGEILVLKAYREPKYPDHLQSVRSEERFSGEVMLRCYTASRSLESHVLTKPLLRSKNRFDYKAIILYNSFYKLKNKKENKVASKSNFVAKHMNTFNRASTHKDKKNDYTRQNLSVNDYLDEWEEEHFIEVSTESSLKRF